MTDTAKGLSDAARERVARQAHSGVHTSLFSAAAAAATLSAGLAAVGEVFGCVVMNLGWSGTGCNWYAPIGSVSPMFGYAPSPRSPVTTSGHGGRYSGFTPYVQAVEAGWNGALERLLTEASALGAHGVVGITIERTRLQNDTWEFTALGTAVRSTDAVLAPRARDGHVWSTDLSPEDTAAAILSGYIPRQLVLGLSVSTKHEDWEMRNQRTSWVNQEVEGMSELILAARHEARERLVARASGTDGAHLVVSQMSLNEFETPCGAQEGEDFHAEAMFVGTTLEKIPRFRTPETSRVLTVIPLRDIATK